MTEEQRRMEVALRQAPSSMFPKLLKLVGAMKIRALFSRAIFERLAIGRDIALLCVAFCTMTQGFGLA